VDLKAQGRQRWKASSTSGLEKAKLAGVALPQKPPKTPNFSNVLEILVLFFPVYWKNS
jgi:hypothetical protein